MKKPKSTLPGSAKSRLVVFLTLIFLTISFILAFVLINRDPKVFRAEENKTAQFIEKTTPQENNTPKTTPPVTEVRKEFSLPILMYHYVRDYNDPNDQIGVNLSVSPNAFEKQMAAIQTRGYAAISLEDLQKSEVPQKAVIITFDDGYADAYTSAYPILKKYGLKATFYIITNRVNTPGYLNWDQIIEMRENGMTIGSHTVSHPSLEKSSREKTLVELVESKRVLEEKIGVTVKDFCFPSGKYSQDTLQALKETGYQTATTTKSGISDQNSSLLELPRLRITNQTNLSNYLLP